MKYTYEHEIEIPIEEKTFILPQPRIKLFENLLENYKVFCPKLKLIYAYLNFNSKNPVDYLIIFTCDIGNKKILLWDAPYLYSNRTIPAYRYICKNDLYDTFFKFCEESICRMDYNKFLEFIPCNLCNLSLDKNSPKYWKKEENADELVSAMAELSLQYTPPPGHHGVTVTSYTKDDMESRNY